MLAFLGVQCGAIVLPAIASLVVFIVARFALLSPSGVLRCFSTGFLRDYPVLLTSITTYGATTLMCVALSLLGQEV